MADRPILFSGPMVRALLDGRKTQTRRIVKPQPHHGPVGEVVHLGDGGWAMDDGDLSGHWQCPCGVPGDRLWVREGGLEGLRPRNFRIFAHDATPGRYWVDSDGGRYGAGYGPAITRDSMLKTGRWKVRPSIHMPRWASRLTLEITDIRVERLHEISDADALAEGVRKQLAAGWFSVPGVDGAGTSARAAYALLWNAINGPGSWDANPWVWAVSFTVHQANVDALSAGRAA
jgi:hypothetical protein